MSGQPGGVVSALFWTAIRTWGERITSLLLFIVLSRLLPPAELGLAAYVLALIAIVQMVADGSFAEWLLRLPERDPRAESTIFWLQLALAGVMSLGLLLVDLAGGFAFLGAEGTQIIAVLAIVIPLGAMERVPTAILRRQHAFRALAHRSMISTICGGGLGLALAFAGFGVWALIIKSLVEPLMKLIATLIAARWRPGFHVDRAVIAKAVPFGLMALATWILTALASRVDAFVVAPVLGVAALGFYAVAARIQQVMSEMLINVVWEAAYAHLAAVHDDIRAFTDVLVRYLTLSTIGISGVVAAVAGAAPALVPIIFGETWASSGDLLRILAVLPWLGALAAFVTCILQAQAALRRSILFSAINLGCIAAGASLGALVDVRGVAIGICAGSFVGLLAGLVACRRYVALTAGDLGRILFPGMVVSALCFTTLALAANVSEGWPAPLRLILFALCGGIALPTGAALTAPGRALIGEGLNFATSRIARRKLALG
ncbi:oligosaccharide flippase family protein [Sphingomonas naphthae]|uniref:Oligosaccharide flippase family protein n=1 Tax=Sphingomonas naphthae TaxID=1813468 RepID=A0ABY7TKI4_9SPHN|nr:oligosaccharide flippase family protein [Sphingomonas naphthae]WCT73227.1 oligosaccharide flippase family protein [Sphingomonas naphthae]